ncbi:MAG: hypothetical protein J5933_05330, partial [Clostridia bacterium]|nr:hypothetical protein [Clostridia bacterium]
MANFMDDNLNRSDGLSDTEGQDISATDLEALMKKYMPEYFEDGKEADPGDPPDAGTVPSDGDAGQKPSNPYEGFVKEYVIDGKSSEDVPFNNDEDAETPAEGAEDLALSVQMPEEDVPVFNFDDEFIDDVPQNAFAVSDDESPDDPYADESAFAGGGLFAKLAERRAQRAARKKSRAQDDDGQIPLDEDLVPPQGEPEPEKPLIPDNMVSDVAENAHETAETTEDADFNPFEAEEITPEIRELFSDGDKSDEPAETAEEVQPDDGQPNEDQPDEGGTEDAAAEEQLPEEVLPEDHDLRVAFGMDENDDGTGRAAEKHPVVNASKTFKLDRPEFVDRSQINDIREEYKKKSRSLWLRLIACAVITVALLIYENIAPLTSIFTGNARQLSGAFDPAVYPTVYAMISLQLMLLACL